MKKLGRPVEPIEIRFWNKVVKGVSCWEWSGGKKGSLGYGSLHTKIDGKNLSVYAHRFSWELHNGPIPSGMIVCHTCDNPLCVNPDHLFLGTHKTNSEDRISKGRLGKTGRSGSANSQAKLTEEDVLEIRASVLTARELSEKFHIDKSRIYQIRNGKGWSHVE